MKLRGWAMLMFVFVGLQAGLSALLVLQATVLLAGGTGMSVLARAFSLVPVAFLCWVAYRLVRDRSRLAEAMFPTSPDEDPTPMQAGLSVLGVSLVGLFLAVMAAPEFLTWVFELPAALQAREEMVDGPLTAARAISATVDAIAGVVILINREAIAERLVGRQSGVDEVATPE